MGDDGIDQASAKIDRQPTALLTVFWVSANTIQHVDAQYDKRRRYRQHQCELNRGCHRLAYPCATTWFSRTPRPSISIWTREPGCSGPTPCGRPVAIKSPGSTVMAEVTYALT